MTTEGPTNRPPVGALILLLTVMVVFAAPLRAARSITFDVNYWGGVLTANYLGQFFVEGDLDFYDGLPHALYWICLQETSAFVVEAQCDEVSFNEGYGPGRGIVPFAEALDPLRGQRVDLWVQAYNLETSEWDWSYAVQMRAALSNIALRPPPGQEGTPPFTGVYPKPTSVVESLDAFTFRWPKTTTGVAGAWGGYNTGATKHILTIQLQQSSATCERTKWACPGAGNVCADTDPLACTEAARGYCTYEESCAKISDQQSFEIGITGLTGTAQDVGLGKARETVLGDGFTYIEFFPDQDVMASLLSQVKADRMSWQVATCTTIGGVETCGRSESFVHLGQGIIGIPADECDPEIEICVVPNGDAFGDSPLVQTFRHSACLECHVLERDATATPPVGLGALHNNFVGGAQNLTNPTACSGCHSSTLAPQILGTAYASAHNLPSDALSWWAWFAPEYEGSLTWPQYLEDPASADYDPATACVLFKQATPTGDAMKSHLFGDPRVIWSIVGGKTPNNNFVDELAPPGSALSETSSLSDQLAVLDQWEQWVDEWVDGGMNCGSTYGGTSYGGGGGNEAVNTTPPVTTSDGSSGTRVGGAVGSGATTIAHLDCAPDQDSASAQCVWTFFACGSDAAAVQTLIQSCSEQTAQFYKAPEVFSPAGLCDRPATDRCYKIDPADGSSGYYSVVQIPAEIGDRTSLAYFSIDAEGNQEIARSEIYDFVEADLVAPSSGVELFYDIAAAEHKLRFSCHDNSDACMIFYTSNDPGEDSTPELDFPPQLLNSHGGASNSDGNILGYLKTDRVQRIRWAAIDGAAGQKNVEFDRLCKQTALELCPGKLTQQNACVATCTEGIRTSCELGCAAGAGGGGTVESDCVAACVAESPTDCLSGCAESCEPTNTGCPGTGGSTGVPLDKSCNSRTNPIQCYHEFVYDPVVFGDTDPPEAFWSGDLGPRADGTYERGFRVHLQCLDPVNECELFFTLDGSEPTADPRLRYTDAIVVSGPTTGRTATTTLRFFAQDNAVPPNASPVQTVPLTVAQPHTDDDHDGFTEDEGDCNDGNDQIFPAAPEICDLIDNNCNGSVDEGLSCQSESIFSDGFETGDRSAWSGGS